MTAAVSRHAAPRAPRTAWLARFRRPAERPATTLLAAPATAPRPQAYPHGHFTGIGAGTGWHPAPVREEGGTWSTASGPGVMPAPGQPAVPPFGVPLEFPPATPDVLRDLLSALRDLPGDEEAPAYVPDFPADRRDLPVFAATLRVMGWCGLAVPRRPPLPDFRIGETLRAVPDEAATAESAVAA